MVRLRGVRTCAHGKLSLEYFSDTKEIQKISLGFFYSLKLQIEQATRDCSAIGITNGSACTK